MKQNTMSKEDRKMLNSIFWRSICDTRNGNNRDHVVVQKCLNSGSISGPIVISNKIGSLHVQNITIRAARKLNSHGILSGRRKTFKWWSKFFLPFTNIFHTNQIDPEGGIAIFFLSRGSNTITHG